MNPRALTSGLILFLVAACASTSTSAPAQPTSRSAPSSTTPPVVTHVQLDLVDTSRPAVDPASERSAPTRALPTELYLPATTEPRPLILFAHGYGGDPSKFTQLFGHWADAGFVVAAPKFPITYTGADSVGLTRAGDLGEQPADLAYVLDQILAGKYRDRIDTQRIGAAGLSLGGGTIWGFIADPCCVDQRIVAAIVMDGNPFGYQNVEQLATQMPLLVYHADQDPALPFESAYQSYTAAGAPKWFITIFGALHAQPFEDSEAAADAMVMDTSTRFWRGTLLGDTRALDGLVPAGTVPDVSTAEAAKN